MIILTWPNHINRFFDLEKNDSMLKRFSSRNITNFVKPVLFFRLSYFEARQHTILYRFKTYPSVYCAENFTACFVLTFFIYSVEYISSYTKKDVIILKRSIASHLSLNFPFALHSFALVWLLNVRQRQFNLAPIC